MTRVYRVRSQHSRGSSGGGFGGPDAYVMGLEIPDGAVEPGCLNTSVLKKRGIRWRYFGEGYSQHTGPRSSLGQAIAEAKEWTLS